jgi:FkbM family methyltransferase
MFKAIVKSLAPPILLSVVRRIRRGTTNDGSEAPIDEVTTFVHGAELVLPLSHNLPHYVSAHPFYDSALPQLASFLRQRRKSPLTVIDVGANFGDTAAIVAAAVGGDQVKFICVEADAQYIPWLQRNTHGLDVEIVHAIAGAASEKIHAATLQTGIGSSAIVESETSENRMVAVDDLTRDPIDILKVDTDGFEFEVMRGAGRVLSQEGIAVFLEYSPKHIRKFGGIDPLRVPAAMWAAGFKRVLVYDNFGTPIGIFPCDSVVIEALSNYSQRRADFYLDLLFDKDNDRLDLFFAQEVKRTSVSIL